MLGFFPSFVTFRISGYRQNSAFDKSSHLQQFGFPPPPPQLLSVKSLLISPSVSGLVLVMPPVEVVVEEDDASGRHAGYDAPEEC